MLELASPRRCEELPEGVAGAKYHSLRKFLTMGRRKEL